MDILEAEQGEKALDEGSRQHVIVMQRDSKKFAATGGWSYEVFKDATKTEREVANIPRNACFTRHDAQREKSLIFSALRN